MNVKLYLLFIFQLLIPLYSHGFCATAEDIGKILGYPASELIITDVLDQEREIYSRPNMQEYEEKKNPPFGPGNLISCYRITGKTAYSFYPMLVTLAKSGTFVTVDFLKFSQNLSQFKTPLGQTENYSQLGDINFGTEGQGGLVLSEMRVPSKSTATRYPAADMATILAVNVPRLNVDIRIAIMAPMDGKGNAPLVLVLGGERYFGMFNSNSDLYEKAITKPPVDIVAIFKQINSSTLLVYENSRGDLQRFTANSNSKTKITALESSWGWVILAVVICFIIITVKKRIKN
jgi:hypothetical protein